ncbi:MAG: hypothetical protein AB2696_17470 [Candidatus Thiodiazotropha sp.]
MRNSPPFFRIGLLICVVVTTGCNGPAIKNEWLKKNAAVLDRMAEIKDEYGTISLSSPMLSLPDERFAFAVKKKGPDEYFADAKDEVHARVAASEQTVSIAGLSVRAQADLTQIEKFAELRRQYEDNRLRYLADQARYDRQAEMKRRAQEKAARLALEAALEEAKTLEGTARKQKEAEAYAAYADAIELPQSPTPPDFPTAPDDESDLPGFSDEEGVRNASEARAVLADEKFANELALLGENPEVAGSNRAALIAGAGDTAVEAMLNVLGQPQDAQKFQGKSTLFGVAMVSVTPGWRTLQNFAAELTVRPTLTWKPARREIKDWVIESSDNQLCDQNRKFPRLSVTPSQQQALTISSEKLTPKFERSVGIIEGDSPFSGIAAVSPMTDIRNLQLASSIRSREEQALSLALALRTLGAKVEAQAFFNYLEQFEQDVLTRNEDVPVAAFSTGSQFGYQVGPVLRGLDDPTFSKPRPVYKMTRQTFPVLILLGFDDEVLRPVIACSASDHMVEVYEPHVKFEQLRRWVPLVKSAATNTLKESSLIALNEDAFLAARSESVGVDDKQFGQVAIRSRTLTEHLFESWTSQALPLEMIMGSRQSEVNHVFPSKLTLPAKGGQSTTLVYLGGGFDQLDLDKKDVEILTGNAVVEQISLRSKNRLEVKLTVADIKPPFLRLAFKTKGNNASRVIATAVELVRTKAPTSTKPVAVPAIALVYPNTIKLKSPSVQVPETQTITLAGENLGKLVLSKANIKLLGSAATVTKDAVLDKGTLEITLQFSAAQSPLALQFCIAEKDGKCDTKKPRYVLSPPISVTMPTKPTAASASTASTVTYSVKDGDKTTE